MLVHMFLSVAGVMHKRIVQNCFKVYIFCYFVNTVLECVRIFKCFVPPLCAVLC